MFTLREASRKSTLLGRIIWSPPTRGMSSRTVYHNTRESQIAHHKCVDRLWIPPIVCIVKISTSRSSRKRPRTFSTGLKRDGFPRNVLGCLKILQDSPRFLYFEGVASEGTGTAQLMWCHADETLAWNCATMSMSLDIVLHHSINEPSSSKLV